MSVIESLTRKFSHTLTEKRDETQNEVPVCQDCRNDSWWKPKNRDEWICETCSPPPSPSFVADRKNSRPVLLRVFEVAACVPWCKHCKSQRGIEKQFSDGSESTICFVCKKPLSDWPDVPRPIPAKDPGTPIPMELPSELLAALQ